MNSRFKQSCPRDSHVFNSATESVSSFVIPYSLLAQTEVSQFDVTWTDSRAQLGVQQIHPKLDNNAKSWESFSIYLSRLIYLRNLEEHFPVWDLYR